MIECGRRGCPSAPGWWCPKCLPRTYPAMLPDLRDVYPARRL
jgi:hypothetical protein